ncbi:unnamed protein product, partial [Didymodactylos carnosus]
QRFGSFIYTNRFDQELIKLAARGLTVVASSGDGGTSNVGFTNNDISGTDPTCTPFLPIYPSYSHYVVSVGASFQTKYYLGAHTKLVSKLGEVPVSISNGQVFTSGSGFANQSREHPLPKWQKHVVKKYLKNQRVLGLLPPTGPLNQDGSSNLKTIWNPHGRAYPDVVALGSKIFTIIGAKVSYGDGTSLSAPIFAGLLSLINDALLNKNLPPLGLAAPFLYWAAARNSSSFNDIVYGTNKDGVLQAHTEPFAETCPTGFHAAVGWDAVSGLGSPNFAVLRELAIEQAKIAKNKRNEKT